MSTHYNRHYDNPVYAAIKSNGTDDTEPEVNLKLAEWDHDKFLKPEAEAEVMGPNDTFKPEAEAEVMGPRHQPEAEAEAEPKRSEIVREEQAPSKKKRKPL